MIAGHAARHGVRFHGGDFVIILTAVIAAHEQTVACAVLIQRHRAVQPVGEDRARFAVAAEPRPQHQNAVRVERKRVLKRKNAFRRLRFHIAADTQGEQAGNDAQA